MIVFYTVIILILVTALGIWVWRRGLRYCEQAAVADWGVRWLNRLDGLNRIFCRWYHRLRHDPVPLPASGGALVVSNHISGLDPLLMVAASPRPLRFIIAEEEYNRWWLRWLFSAMGCIPVTRSGNPQQAFRAAREALDQGEIIALFPQGRIHLDHEPPARLKRGVALLAQMTEVPVCPIRIKGIRGQGRTFTAVLLRSRARITCFDYFEFNDNLQADLKRLGDLIRGQATISQSPAY